jgi:serine/threonine protein kinase
MNGMVHSDIKPENITCVPNPDATGYEPNDIKYIDFGMAYFVNRYYVQVHEKIYQRQGTPEYISPDLNAAYYIWQHDIDGLLEALHENIYSYRDFRIDDIIEMPTKMNISNTITHISQLMQNGTYDAKFIKPIVGYAFLGDVYALGITIAQIAHRLNMHLHSETRELIHDMTLMDPSKRPNIIKCLHNPLFKILKARDKTFIAPEYKYYLDAATLAKYS